MPLLLVIDSRALISLKRGSALPTFLVCDRVQIPLRSVYFHANQIGQDHQASLSQSSCLKFTQSRDRVVVGIPKTEPKTIRRPSAKYNARSGLKNLVYVVILEENEVRNDRHWTTVIRAEEMGYSSPSFPRQTRSTAVTAEGLRSHGLWLGRYHRSHTISSSRLTGVFDTFPNSAKNVQYKFGISTQAIAIRVLTEQTVRRVLFLKYKFIASSPPTACLQRFKFEPSFFVKFKNPFR